MSKQNITQFSLVVEHVCTGCALGLPLVDGKHFSTHNGQPLTFCEIEQPVRRSGATV